MELRKPLVAVALAFALVVVLAAAAPAIATPTNLNPANNATIPSAARTFSWTDAQSQPPVNYWTIEIATRPEVWVSNYGMFYPQNLVWTYSPITKFITVPALNPGVYYWHVMEIHGNPLDITYGYSWSPVQVFTVTEPPPVIVVNPTSLSFAVQQGDTSWHTRTFAVSNSGGGVLFPVCTGPDPGWWRFGSVTVANEVMTVPVEVNASRLAAGTYRSRVTVSAGAGTSPPASNSPQYVEIALVVSAAPPTNHPPYLSSGAVFPQTGDTNTDFTFQVHYSDQDGDTPADMKLVCDGVGYPMTYAENTWPDTNRSGTCRSGPLRLGVGTHSYHFEVSDGHGGSTLFPSSGNLDGPVVSPTAPPPVDSPYINSLTPTHGTPAASVVIAGSNFGATQGASLVKFGDTAASVSNWSASSIACAVPRIATGATTVTVTVGGHVSNAAAFTIDAVPITPAVALKLGGLRAGAVTLGRRVTAKCIVTPTSLAGERCKLTVQKKKGTRWAKVAGLTGTIGATGTYSWKYKPATRGSYRMQAKLVATATHAAAKTPWRAFKVK